MASTRRVSLLVAGMLCCACGHAVSDARAAAERGDARAQFQLGQAYFLGDGEQRDHVAALAWYQRAADQGDVEAMAAIGLVHAIGGHGVPEDEVLAAKWYRLAAERGSAQGQYNLGLMYLVGSAGTPADEAAASEWIGRAAAQGHSAAKFRLEQLEERRRNDGR